MYWGPTDAQRCVKKQVDAGRHLPIVAELVIMREGSEQAVFSGAKADAKRNVGLALCRPDEILPGAKYDRGVLNWVDQSSAASNWSSDSARCEKRSR